MLCNFEMIVLLVITFGICTIINGKNLETKTDKKIEKLFGKILSSDHIDELAEKIAAKAVEKFYDLQQKVIVTIDNNVTFDNLPLMRGRKVAEKVDDLQPPQTTAKVTENEGLPHHEQPTQLSYQHTEEEYTVIPAATPTLSSITVEKDPTPDPNYIQTQNLPLKNLGYKYRKQTELPNREFDDAYGPMPSMDKIISQEKPQEHENHSFLQDSVESIKKPVLNDSLHFSLYSNEKVIKRLKQVEEFEESPQHDTEPPTVPTILLDPSPKEQISNETIPGQEQGDQEYSDEGSREKTETTTIRTKPTRIENNKLYAYQSSDEYADYHQSLARSPVTEIMFRKRGAGEQAM